MKALRLALAPTLFELGLWKLGAFVFPKSGGVFLHDGRIETRKGTRVG